jgi:YgiT-type zinc finger domain-containing protein
MISQNGEYGECFCQTEYEVRVVEVDLTVDDKLVVLNKIPQGVCPRCGSRVCTAEILETIESVMRGWQHDSCLSQAHI